MTGRRPRAATGGVTEWSTAATATLAIMAAPFGSLPPSGAEAFIPSPAASTTTSHGKFAGHAIKSVQHQRFVEGGTAALAVCIEGGTSVGWRTRSYRRASGGARSGKLCRSCGLGASRGGMPDSEWTGDTSGMREDEMFPDKPSVFSSAGAAEDRVGGEDISKGEDEREEEVDDDGSWSDAEVERRVAERRVAKFDPYAEREEDMDEDDGEEYMEIIANMTKPLGITIEASTDKAELIYITSVGEQAEACGLEVGDVLTGVSAVFGEDVWSVKGKSIDKVRSLVRCRREPYVLVRVERGHISLEERCREGFGVTGVEDCWRLTDEGECEVGYSDLWASVYKEEMAVLQGGKEAGGGVQGGGGQRKTNEPPPPRNTGFGLEESWKEDEFEF